MIHNKEGKLAATLWSGSEGGKLGIYNKEGKRAVFLGILNGDGVIGLSDRYGEPGWAMTGKR